MSPCPIKGRPFAPPPQLERHLRLHFIHWRPTSDGHLMLHQLKGHFRRHMNKFQSRGAFCLRGQRLFQHWQPMKMKYLAFRNLRRHPVVFCPLEGHQTGHFITLEMHFKSLRSSFDHWKGIQEGTCSVCF